MEKLGVSKEDLLAELKAEYLKLREMQKTASADPLLTKKLEQLKDRIDDLEYEGNV